MMLRQIGRRTHNEFAIQASLHGVKIPLIQGENETAVPEPDFDPKEVERAMIEAQARVKGRIQGRGRNG